MTKTKQQLLEELRSTLEKNAQKLPLAKKASDIVPPEGNPEAQLMFIGEAAGRHEQVQRRPFVGVAGKLLTKTLKEIDIEREDVWITNVLKVRPPKNRDPQSDEIEAYSFYLDREIQIIKPKIIVTLGRFSMSKFIPNAYISKIHGKARWVDWKEMRLLIFPMYHPAAALRRNKVMEDFRNDFHKLLQTIKLLNKQDEDKEKQDLEENNEENNGQMQLL